MHSARKPPVITVTTHDYDRLSTLVDSPRLRRRGVRMDFLDDELERADLVGPAEVAPDVVTMSSCVRIRDIDTGQVREVTLVWPGEEDSVRGKISILTPLGAALLGLSEGARMDWLTLDGRRKSLAVVEVRYQPEAHGHDIDARSVELA